MDYRSAYSVSVYPDRDVAEDSNVAVLAQLEDFVMRFRLDNKFIYRFVALAQAIVAKLLF
jgi:hypothetical protein